MTRRASVLATVVGPLLGLAVLGLTVPRQSRPELSVLGGWATWTTAAWRMLPWKPKHPQAFVVAAVLCLVVCWLAVAWKLVRAPDGVRQPWFAGTVVAWVAPFALGAPAFSRDVYSYAAQGELMRRGVDPYVHPVAVLGPHSSVLAAADPTWWTSVTPYGPVALRLEQLAASVGAGNELAALILLRAVSLLCLVGLVVLVRHSVHPGRRDLATWLVCSPLVLVHGLSPAHLDLPVALLLVCAALLGQKRRFVAAAALIVLAGEIKATALIALLVLAVYAFAEGRRETARCLAGSVVALAGSCLIYVQDPLGWISALSTPGSHWNPYTPSSVLLLVVGEARRHVQLLGPSGLGPLLRALAALTGGGIAVRLLSRSRRTAAASIGLFMLVVLLAAPVVWPWYLVPCAVLLLFGEVKDWSVSCALGAAAAMVALPIKIVPAQRVAVFSVAAAVVVVWVMRRRSNSFNSRLTSPSVALSQAVPYVDSGAAQVTTSRPLEAARSPARS